MENGKPHVSIGLPVYNGEKYIMQAIDSILAQTYRDFELIISDNASTDQTQAICQKIANQDKRIRYYRNEKNLGAAPNFNRVFELSVGEFFKWMAYDDLIDQIFLSRCVEILENNPDVVLCFPRSKIIDEDGNVLGEHEYKSDTTSPKPHIRFQNLVITLDMGWQVFGLMRASAVKKTALHGSYPASDLVLLAELALYGTFYEIPEYLLLPRYHREQATRLIPVERDRVAFYDTGLKGKIQLPKWQYLYGYIKAIKNAPLNMYERSFCYAQLVHWVFIPHHFRALGKDLLLAGQELTKRALVKSKTKTELKA